MAEQPTTEQPYPDGDVWMALQATGQHTWVRTTGLGSACCCGYQPETAVAMDEHRMRAALDALAAAGRLLPEGASPNLLDLGDGYRQIELAQGRWTWIDELGVRVMVELQRPLILLRWRPVSINEENTEPPPSAATIASVMDGDDG